MNWGSFLAVTNVQGTLLFTNSSARTNDHGFFRARK